MTYICSAPNCLMVYGDMGECMWQREYDMIPFVRGSVDSLGYFSEKAVRDCEVKIEYKELIDEWLETIKDETVLDGSEWGEEEDKALEELRDFWKCSETVEQFMWEFSTSKLCYDCDSFPTVTFYTYHYLWKIELLKWFIQQLDGGHVLPYREPAEATP